MGITLWDDCQDEFEIELWEDPDQSGEQGHVSSYVNNAEHAICEWLNCNGVGEASEEAEWEIGEVIETGPGEGTMQVRACFDSQPEPLAIGLHCTLEMDFSGSGSGPYTFTTDSLCGSLRVVGEWQTESSSEEYDQLEVVHP